MGYWQTFSRSVLEQTLGFHVRDLIKLRLKESRIRDEINRLQGEQAAIEDELSRRYAKEQESIEC